MDTKPLRDIENADLTKRKISSRVFTIDFLFASSTMTIVAEALLAATVITIGNIETKALKPLKNWLIEVKRLNVSCRVEAGGDR